MTIDERIEALTARHEALTMNLELLSRDREKDNGRIQSLLHITENLAHVAASHERRITGLEDGTT